MNLIYLILTIVLISLVAAIEVSYISVSGVKTEQEKNNYLSYMSSKRNEYSQLLLSDGSLNNEDDKKDFMLRVTGDEMFKSPILSSDESDKYYICIERVSGRDKVLAAKQVVEVKSKTSFFISDCNDYGTKTQEYKDDAYIAFFLE